ncbi:MAG: hypothetical protein ACRENP_26900 [Longimicrobiales bacterium]
MKATIAVMIAAASVLALACASGGSGGSGSSRARCRLAPQDSVFLANGPVYRDCAVDARAVLLNPNVAIDYRPTITSGSRCYEVQLVFVVDARGIPETQSARVVKATEPNLANAVLASLGQFRYQPAQKEGVPVRQIVQFGRRMSVGLVAVRSGTPPPRPPGC